MMQDERVMADVLKAKNIGYNIFWFGVFAILLYQWFVLDLTLKDNGLLFGVWIVASVVQFWILAIKGIPITYPVTASKKEQVLFMIFVPLLCGGLSAAILFFFKEDVAPMRIFLGFVFGSVCTFIIFFAYKMLLHMWERKHLDV